MKGEYGISEMEIGIKDHVEHDMEAAMCGDLKYLNGEDPAKYSLKQEDELAKNLRKHREK
jgi:hypothetical protein